MLENFRDLKGRILTDVYTTGGEAIYFEVEGEGTYRLYHKQDCCEGVYIESIVGDLDDLIGEPITMAIESTAPDEEASQYGMWTFYKLATVKGYVDIRWNGRSNGYYSVAVTFDRV